MTIPSVSRNPKVLHLGKYFPPVPGGMETFCADLQLAYASRPVESRMLVHLRPGQPAPQVPGVCGVQTWGEAFFTPVARGLGSALNREISQFKPDLLHFHLPNPAAFRALWLPAARSLPWVVHWQSDVLASAHQWRLRIAYPVYRQFEKRLVARATAVVATSPDYAAASPALAGLDKVRVIPLGIDPRRLESRGQPPEWPGDGLRVLAVGRLTYYKGFDVLLEAMKLATHCTLLLLGAGAEEPRLRALVERLDLGARVRLVNDADDAQRNAALAAADCLCLPSIERTEAFGLVLLEAMAMGLPVIATRIPGSGVAWVVREGGHGLLAEPADAEDLSRCLDRMATEPDIRKGLQEKARENFPRFHIDEVADRIIDLYRSLVA